MTEPCISSVRLSCEVLLGHAHPHRYTQHWPTPGRGLAPTQRWDGPFARYLQICLQTSIAEISLIDMDPHLVTDSFVIPARVKALHTVYLIEDKYALR